MRGVRSEMRARPSTGNREGDLARRGRPARQCSMRKAMLLCAILLLVPAIGRAQAISAQEAARHIGQTATVCGVVASARYASRSRSQPTFLNLGEPYPHQVFTVVIWGDDRSKFGRPEITYAGKRVCSTGEIRRYRGKPEMILSDPGQLRLDTGRASYAPPSGSPRRTAPSE